MPTADFFGLPLKGLFYMNMKRKIKTNSTRAYSSAVSRIKASKFGQKQIRSVKTSDAKAWFVELHDDGLKQNTITVLHSVLRPAFEMAVEDDILRKNPFKFKLSDLIPDDSQERVPLTKDQQENISHLSWTMGMTITTMIS